MGTGITAAVIVLQINFLFCITFRTVKVLSFIDTLADAKNSFHRPANSIISFEMIVGFITQLVMDGISSKPENPHKDNRKYYCYIL